MKNIFGQFLQKASGDPASPQENLRLSAQSVDTALLKPL